MPETELTEALLGAAVSGIGGAHRPGQHEMAEAVGETLAGGDHLLVQAGTGTGKSLGYLAPTLARLVESPQRRIIIATATLALQAQLANSDIPAALDACEAVTGSRPSFAVLKGRTNYACLYRARDGQVADQDSLLGGEVVAVTAAKSGDAASRVGGEVVALRAWVEEQAKADAVADRDDAPRHGPQAWAQVSIPTRECPGVANCRFGSECFVEKSRDRARAAQLVVTNHALMAIDAMHGGTALPEHDAVVVDEAHELVSRVTSAAAHELSPQQIERVARRCLTWLSDEAALELLEAGESLREALDEAEVARVEDPEGALVTAIRRVAQGARAAVSEATGGNDDPERKQAGAAVREVFDVAQEMSALGANDVVWVSERERFGRQLNVAPLSVAGLMREGIFAKRQVVLTSATLTVGGSFEAVAASVGLTRGSGEEDPPAWPGTGRRIAV